jgi:hypothetical protein
MAVRATSIRPWRPQVDFRKPDAGLKTMQPSRPGEARRKAAKLLSLFSAI